MTTKTGVRRSSRRSDVLLNGLVMEVGPRENVAVWCPGSGLLHDLEC